MCKIKKKNITSVCAAAARNDAMAFSLGVFVVDTNLLSVG